ncbi:hypothetical protein B0O99DRAFT_740757 [Bisporella sp. PMI_857]|nr:hypothetical protein B0O99DRAFT_740757 [Bisporella sp. PMI_857]
MATPIGGRINNSITKQEWESMKSFIQRVYIDENKSFPYLAAALLTEFGLEPTKRQFSRKVEEWGFRKNVSQSERRNIMKNFETGLVVQTIKDKDRRVNARKLENWKKRYKKDATLGEAIGSFNIAVPGLDVLTPDHQSPSMQSSLDVHIVPRAPHIFDKINSLSIVEEVGTHIINTEPKNGGANTWPFDWRTVDVHGSPGLSRLFEGLEIESSMPIPAISLDADTMDESEYITQHGLSQLWTAENKSRTYRFEISHDLRNSGLIQENPDCETRFLPWRNPRLTFCGWNASPFNEIYVFPKPPMRIIRKSPNRNLAWLEAQTIEYELRLDKLTPLCGSQHPGVRLTMNALAKIYHTQGKYVKAERWYRAVFDANRAALGTENFVTLDSGISWIEALVAQGEYLHARTLIIELRTTILTAHGHESALHARASFLEARIAGTLGNFAIAEALTREVLQKRLNDFGPRYSDTWRCIDYLAWILERQSRFSGAEKLSRMALQLHHEIVGLDEGDLCSAKRWLSLICSYQGRYDESRSLSRLLQENLEGSLGAEHPLVLEAQYALAVCLRRGGRFQESERLYRKVWSQRLKVLGESHPDTWSTANSLAYLLYQMNCFEESIVWYEKVFWKRLELFGPDSDQAMNSCCWLGDCYQKLGRYDDALKLYKRIADKIREAKGEENPVLGQAQGLTAWTMRKILMEGKEVAEESSIVKERRKKRRERRG